MVYLVRHGQTDWNLLKKFAKRNCDFCDMIKEKHRNDNILIVTHAANARIINYYFSGKPKDYDFGKKVAQNGAVLIFENSEL